MSSVITKLRVYCQLSCKPAPLSNKLANPPYRIHNFAWKEGISNNDDDHVKLVDGNLTAHLDTKAISVTASKKGQFFSTQDFLSTLSAAVPVQLTWCIPLLSTTYIKPCGRDVRDVCD